MRGSEFIAANAGKSLAQWEAAAIALAALDPAGGGIVPWPMIPIEVEIRGWSDDLKNRPPMAPPIKHRGRYFVTSDYFAIGIPPSAGQAGDYVRMPLTPGAAQSVANTKGMFLPTAKMVDDIWRVSTRLVPQPLIPNKGANLFQYAEHSRLIDAQLASPDWDPGLTSPLRSGHKKDVILSNIWKPGKVVIYGWHRPDGTFIQPKSNIHGDFYVDYSHGIRLVSPNMEVDGKSIAVEDVLKSSELAPLLSSEGPLRRVRYPALPLSAGQAGGTNPARVSYFDLGFSTLIALGRRAA